MSTRNFIFILVAALYLLLGVALLHGNPAPKHSEAYSSGVNAALNMTLQVGAEWRALHVSFTWIQLQSEVARRLRVQRTEPWRGKR